MSDTTVLNRFLGMREVVFMAAFSNPDGSRATRPDAFDRLLSRVALYEMFLIDSKQEGEFNEYITGLRLDSKLEEEQ